MKIRIPYLLSFCLLLLAFSPAQTPGMPNVDAVLQRYAKDLGTNFVVMVQKEGKDIYKNQSGDMKIDSQEPIGASSQWLTAALVLNLVDEGKISLDDPIATYIPIFASYSKSYITIRHCLSQTTGIENEIPKLGKLLQRKKYETLEAEVNDYASKKDIKDKPGNQFFYGSIGMNIAGRICEIVTKKNFDRLIGERILKPLMMRKTNFQTDGMTAVSPAFGAKSSAADYLKFMNMLLNKGTGNGKKILSEASVAELIKMQTGNANLKFTPAAAVGYSYGYGCWLLESGNTVASPSFTGTWPYIDLKRNYAAIVFTRPLENTDQNRNMYEHIKETIDGSIQ